MNRVWHLTKHGGLYRAQGQLGVIRPVDGFVTPVASGRTAGATGLQGGPREARRKISAARGVLVFRADLPARSQWLGVWDELRNWIVTAA